MENKNSEVMEKKKYDTPTLIVHGNIETITLAQQLGSKLDSFVPVGGSVLGHLS